jgi:hypothetical protein
VMAERIEDGDTASTAVNRQLATGTTYGRYRRIESTARYLGIEVDDALAIAEQVDV